MFGLGDSVSYDLVLAFDRALAIGEQPAARGSLLRPVGVLDDQDLETGERLREIERCSPKHLSR